MCALIDPSIYTIYKSLRNAFSLLYRQELANTLFYVEFLLQYYLESTIGGMFMDFVILSQLALSNNA